MTAANIINMCASAELSWGLKPELPIWSLNREETDQPFSVTHQDQRGVEIIVLITGAYPTDVGDGFCQTLGELELE